MISTRVNPSASGSTSNCYYEESHALHRYQSMSQSSFMPDQKVMAGPYNHRYLHPNLAKWWQDQQTCRCKTTVKELETQAQVLTNQLRRQDEEARQLRENMEAALQRERALQSRQREFQPKYSDLESKKAYTASTSGRTGLPKKKRPKPY